MEPGGSSHHKKKHLTANQEAGTCCEMLLSSQQVLKNNSNLFESSCDQIKHHVTESCKLTSGLFSHWSTDLSVKPLASQWRHCRDPATGLLTARWTVAWWEWSAAVMSLTLSLLIGGFWSWRFWLEVMWPRCFHWPARYVQTTWFMFSFYTWNYYCLCPLGEGAGSLSANHNKEEPSCPMRCLVVAFL